MIILIVSNCPKKDIIKMENILSLIGLGIICFFFTYILIFWWIKSARKMKFVGKDMNKFNRPAVAESGGLPVVLGISFALLLYIFVKVFYLKNTEHVIESFAILTSILLACLLGIIDDILGWKIGLRIWQKVIFTFPVAIPLMVVDAGHSIASIPFFGQVEFGLLYPLVIIPIAIIGAANGFNMLAGYNGLEVGLGLVILGTLSIVAAITDNLWLAFVGALICVILFAFLLFNWYPAKIFPGDSFTHSVGALIAIFAILGDMEKVAVFLFFPYFIDAFLQIKGLVVDRSGLVEAFGKPNETNSLVTPRRKSYKVSHIIIKLLNKFKGSAYEKGVVWSFILFELFLAVVAIILVLV